MNVCVGCFLLPLLLMFACSKKDAATSGTSVAADTAQATPPASSQAVSPANPSPPPAFDSGRAMKYVKEIVALGPRPIGSENHKKVENYILTHLKGLDTEQDAFDIHPSEGTFPVTNIIAKFPGTKDGIIVIASHYETNWPLRNTSYIGANDGASSSALLLEFANQLRGKKLDGYSVWLLWDDAEESMQLPWYDPESLYGVRHLADKWQADGTLKKIKAFILEDMIGDADLNILKDSNSSPWLEDLLYLAATNLGYQSHFFGVQGPEIDDHLPFTQRGVPAIDIIDPVYGYNDVFHHTTEDTVDKLSPKSLEIVGTVTLEMVRLLNQR
ncbi:MAG TPA: M28 family peptidase [Terriglobales bacterium]|nr:M28 family peptidase [Terriglobales bacterium]